jgi:hypothetical protein
MSRRRIAIGGLLLAALMCLDERVACGQPSALTDVWFTNTRAAGRAEWRSREPQQIWPRVDTFVQGKDALAILLIVFNDQRAHQVRGVRKDPDNREWPFRFDVLPRTVNVGWRAVYYVWPVDKIPRGKHLVDLAVDEVRAGTLSFTVRPPE